TKSDLSSDVCSSDLGQLSISSADFAVLVIDVDNFKDFNDRYGHLIGDRVLREIADILSDLTRDNYYYYRYGGEEFITIVEKCSEDRKSVVYGKIVSY